ncbi:hypothetical protein B0H17DRAFT_1049601, partial [Mycena rosella]
FSNWVFVLPWSHVGLQNVAAKELAEQKIIFGRMFRAGSRSLGRASILVSSRIEADS